MNYVISEAQLVREYYANVGKTLLRSYAMIQLAYMLTSLSQHRNLSAEANDERKFYLERYEQFHHAVERMLGAANRDLWKCNPNPYLDSRKHCIFFIFVRFNFESLQTKKKFHLHEMHQQFFNTSHHSLMLALTTCFE